MISERKNDQYVIDIHNKNDSEELAKLDRLINLIDHTVTSLNDLIKFNWKNSSRRKKKCLYYSRNSCAVLINLASLAYCAWTTYAAVSIAESDPGYAVPLGIFAAVNNLFGSCMIFFTCKEFKNAFRLRSNWNIREAFESIPESEKLQFLEFLSELEINHEEHTVQSLIECLQKKKEEIIFQKDNGPRKTAFMLGSIHRLTDGSAIYSAFFNNKPLRSKDTCNLIFQFAGFSKIPKNEQAEEVRKILHNSIFLTKTFDQDKDELVLETVLQFAALK